MAYQGILLQNDPYCDMMNQCYYEHSWVSCFHFQCRICNQARLAHLQCHRKSSSVGLHLVNYINIRSDWNAQQASVLREVRYLLPNVENPSCLQTTSAARLFQPESQILPQVWLIQTWTVPFLGVDPCVRRTLPSVQLSREKEANIAKCKTVGCNRKNSQTILSPGLDLPKHLTPTSW